MRFSIITVCYNSESTISRCIESVRGQVFTDFEHVIVDGQSRDRTVSIAKDLGVTKILSEPDSGLYDAMNKGAQIAEGEFLIFLNSDDMLYSRETLLKISDTIDRHPGARIFMGGIAYFNVDPNHLFSYWQPNSNDIDFEDYRHPPHPGFICKREDLLEVGGFNIDFKVAADFDLMLRMTRAVGFSEIHDEIITKMYAGGMSSNISNIIRGNIEVVHAMKSAGLRASFSGVIIKRLAPKAVRKVRHLFSALF